MAQVPEDATHSKDAANAKDVGNAKAAVQSQPPRVPAPTENGASSSAAASDALPVPPKSNVRQMAAAFQQMIQGEPGANETKRAAAGSR
eukprot:gene6039-2650_t